LTEGRPGVLAVHAIACPEAAVLRLAAGLESSSEHPIARAILDCAAARGLTPDPIEDFRAIPGAGVRARRAGQTALLGSPAFVRSEGIAIQETDLNEAAAPYASIIAVALDGVLIGLLSIADTIRPSSAPAVARLQAMGIRTIMLTGDRRQTAESVGATLGIAEIRAELMPDQKLAEVKRLRAEGCIVGMVGDGINDAPALAMADVSFALAGGTGIAIDTADVTLMRGDLCTLPDAIELSRRTLSKIRQNLFLAFFYNVLGIPLAALGMLSPLMAGAAMAASSVSVVSNALLLGRWRPRGADRPPAR
jgi:P-type Cu+ transporter